EEQKAPQNEETKETPTPPEAASEVKKPDETTAKEEPVEAKAEPAVEEEKKAEDPAVEEKVEEKKEKKAAEPQKPYLDPSLQEAKIEYRDGEKFIRLEDLPEDSVYTPTEMSALEQMYSETMTKIEEGSIVPGRIIAIHEKEVAVDIGFKSEGVVPIEEFGDPSTLTVGDTIDVYLDKKEDHEGQLLLSKNKADFMRVWDRVKQVYESDSIIRGRCTRRIKGGMVVDLGGVDAFLPGSQIDVRPVRDFEALISTEMDFRILKINDLRKNVVISHKVLVEESLQEVRETLLNKLEVNDVLEGTVKNITDFGVFVDLGGVDGLLHITDLSWGRVTHPSEIVQLDQRIRVMVLNYDEDRQRISLGLKQLYAHLWDEIDLKYTVGQKVQGKIVSLAKYGAFVELEPGIEGLVHISEMSWTQHVKHPSQVVREGDFVQVMVLNIDKENRKISLGLKQVEEDPWETFESKYKVDSKHKGTVRDLVPFGAFVELEDGIDGLVHISDLSWTRKVRHPGEILKKGQEIEVIVLAFDRNERRIALGYKQLEDNPWELFEREAAIGNRTSGTVTRIIDKGVLVELSHGIEGFVPNSQIAKKFYEGKKRSVQIGDVLKLSVLEFDKMERKVILSNSQAEDKDESKMTASYLPSSGKSGATIADSLEEDNPLLKAMQGTEEEEKSAKKKPKAKKKAKEGDAEGAEADANAEEVTSDGAEAEVTAKAEAPAEDTDKVEVADAAETPEKGVDEPAAEETKESEESDTKASEESTENKEEEKK
ncbi:30S ribosomal protein S1, partial [bacterium]|nr:30S ribosomal protein S1 [bacterium]